MGSICAVAPAPSAVRAEQGRALHGGEAVIRFPKETAANAKIDFALATSARKPGPEAKRDW